MPSWNNEPWPLRLLGAFEAIAWGFGITGAALSVAFGRFMLAGIVVVVAIGVILRLKRSKR